MIFLATVTKIVSNQGINLLIDGEQEPTTKKYTYLASYSSPRVNDRVLVVEIDGSYVVLGKVRK